MKKSPWLSLVISIIAIAIILIVLYPVFAQSKSSAMKASELSYQKQRLLSREMEAADGSVPSLTEMSTASMALQRQVIRKGSISVRVASV